MATPCPVVVGTGLAQDILDAVPTASERVAIVHTETLRATAEAIQEALIDSGRARHPAREVPDGEDAKSVAVAGFCWGALGESGFTRTDAVIGLGGERSPTWQVSSARPGCGGPGDTGAHDAARHGRRGGGRQDRNQHRAGQNLVGAIHSPQAVICDLATLDTVPTNDYVSGLAEVIKCGFIADPRILELVMADVAGARTPKVRTRPSSSGALFR